MRIALLSLLTAGAMVAAAGAQTPVVIDDFDDLDYTTQARDDDSFALSTVAGSEEGSNALEVVFDHVDAGAWILNSRVRRDFDEPLDISGAEYFTLDINVPEAREGMYMVIHFRDENGYTFRHVAWPAFGTSDGDEWRTLAFRKSDLQRTRWSGQGRPMPLNQVSAVAYHIQNSEGVEAGEFTFSLDNFVAYTDADLLNEVVIADFDQYNSTAELQADWQNDGAEGLLAEGAGPDGGNAMAVALDIQQRWTTYGVLYEFDGPQDFSEVIYFQVPLHGDSALDGLNPNFNIYLQDSEGNRAMGLMWEWPMVDEWSMMYLPFPADGIEYFTCDTFGSACMSLGGNTTWREDFWIGGWDSRIDMSEIVSIRIAGQTNTEHAEPVAATLMFGNIVVGFQTDDPPVAPPEDVPSEQTYIVQPLLAPGQVTIDGLVEAGEWDNASDPATGFVLHNDPETPATEDPEIRALWDDTYLYLLYEVQNENFQLAFTPTGDGRDPEGVSFAGDDFEFFIAPGGPMANEYYHIVLFPYEGDGITYIWSEYMAGGVDSWQPAGDAAEFTYDDDTNWLTIEYRIPWTEFNIDPVVTGPPAEGEVWGMQIGFINSDPAEAVNWEPSESAGFANGRPFGSFIFTGEAPEPPPPSHAPAWHLYE